MRLIFTCSLLLASISASSQVYLKGVLTSSFDSHNTGDTLLLSGIYEDESTEKLLYYEKATNVKIPAEKISLLFDEADFWDVQQFYYITHKIEGEGWQLEKRKELETKTLDFIAELESEGKIYSDKYAEDYLQQLVQRIHFPKFSKGRDQNLIIKILDSDQKKWYAFDNGIILISTQLLAEAMGEKEIYRILSEAIAHILLDSNLENVNESADNIYGKLGAIYGGATKKRIQIIAGKYINFYEKNGGGYADEFDFLNAMAGIISYTAWQEYYNNHHQIALAHLDRLMQKNLANSADYLLKAKIYSKMVNNPGSNQQAIALLKTAASFKDQLLPEIYSDLGVMQLREKQYTEARNSFIEYHKMVAANKEEEKIKWALKMINLCDVYLKEKEIDSAGNQ